VGGDCHGAGAARGVGSEMWVLRVKVKGFELVWVTVTCKIYSKYVKSKKGDSHQLPDRQKHII